MFQYSHTTVSFDDDLYCGRARGGADFTKFGGHTGMFWRVRSVRTSFVDDGAPPLASARPTLLTGKRKAQIWCEVVRHIAPLIQALAVLLAVLILIG